jgi:hypothetical protein
VQAVDPALVQNARSSSSVQYFVRATSRARDGAQHRGTRNRKHVVHHVLDKIGDWMQPFVGLSSDDEESSIMTGTGLPCFQTS